PRAAGGRRGSPWPPARPRCACCPPACAGGWQGQACGGDCLMPRLKVTQLKSEIGGKQNQRDTLRTLGLKRIGDVGVKEDRPEIRGMVATVAHLVAVEEVE